MATKNRVAEDTVKKLRQLERARKYTGTIMYTNECHNPFDLRRPTGLTSLDMEIYGGLPAGGLTQIDGPEGVGKNFLMYQCMRRCQEIYGEHAGIAIACFETTIDKDYARRVGLQIAHDPYEIKLIQRERGEKGEPGLTKKEVRDLQDQMGSFAILRGEHTHIMDAIIRLVKSNAFQVIGVDSWDVVLPKAEIDKSMTSDPRVAAPAQLQTQFMNRFHAAMNSRIDDRENETTIIGIRQVRAKMRKMFMNERPYEAQGARSIRHGKLLNISLHSGKNITDSSGKKLVGKYVNWHIAKAKAGSHEGPKGDYAYYFDPPGFDAVIDLFDFGVTEGVITKKGGKYTAGTLEGNEEGIKHILSSEPEARQALLDELVFNRGYNIRFH